MKWTGLSLLLIMGLVFCAGNLSAQEELVSKQDFVEVAESDKVWTGVAVSKEGRIFVSYPRWSDVHDISVAELTAGGKIIPYPDEKMNSWDPSLKPNGYFICVQSVYMDYENYLWILDPASPMIEGVVEGGPRLLKVDLEENRVIQKIIFGLPVAPKESYLNDVRVDTEKKFAYISDSGTGAIVVVNLETGNSRRVLHSHYSTKAEGISLVIEGNEFVLDVHVDGIALDPEREYVYYQALGSRNLYRIGSRWLRDETLREEDLGKMVEFVGTTGAADGIAFGRDGKLYLSSIEHNAIRRYDPESGKTEVVLWDEKIRWPDSFSVTPEGTIYFTVSQLHLDHPGEPYRIFRFRPEDDQAETK
jgi:sugar lactone lactonase YvrE